MVGVNKRRCKGNFCLTGVERGRNGGSERSARGRGASSRSRRAQKRRSLPTPPYLTASGREVGLPPPCRSRDPAARSLRRQPHTQRQHTHTSGGRCIALAARTCTPPPPRGRRAGKNAGPAHPRLLSVTQHHKLNTQPPHTTSQTQHPAAAGGDCAHSYTTSINKATRGAGGLRAQGGSRVGVKGQVSRVGRRAQARPQATATVRSCWASSVFLGTSTVRTPCSMRAET